MKTLTNARINLRVDFSPYLTALWEVMDSREKEPIGGDFTGNMTWKERPCSLSVFFASCVSGSSPPGCDSWCPPLHMLPRIMFMVLEAMVALKLWTEMSPPP